jgi:hypothetical protein
MATRSRKQIIDGIIRKAWLDDDFKRELFAEPARVLRAAGLPVPDDLEIQMHEDNFYVEHGVLPTRPDDAHSRTRINLPYCFTEFRGREHKEPVRRKRGAAKRGALKRGAKKGVAKKAASKKRGGRKRGR